MVLPLRKDDTSCGHITIVYAMFFAEKRLWAQALLE
jgi:hypothetical protein